MLCSFFVIPMVCSIPEATRYDYFWLVHNWYMTWWYTYNDLFYLLCHSPVSQPQLHSANPKYHACLVLHPHDCLHQHYPFQLQPTAFKNLPSLPPPLYLSSPHPSHPPPWNYNEQKNSPFALIQAHFAKFDSTYSSHLNHSSPLNLHLTLLCSLPSAQVSLPHLMQQAYSPPTHHSPTSILQCSV